MKTKKVEISPPPGDDLLQLLELKSIELEQAKHELEIEAALERVRSSTMGMHQSDELREVVAGLYQELEKLDFNIRQCVITILDKEAETAEWWSTGLEERILPRSYTVSYKDPEIYKGLSVQAFIDAIDQKVPFRMTELSGENKRRFDKILLEHTGLKDLPETMKAGMMAVERLFISDAFMQYGLLEVVGTEPLASEKTKILQRFARVFEQTYTRFIDLQKAEAQAREAQIEVAVERVRAKALAMHKSEEIISVLRSLRQELENLQIPGVVSTTIYLAQDDGRIRFWDLTTIEELNKGDHTMDKYLRLEECPDFLWFQRMFRSMEKYAIIDQDKDELRRSMEWIRQNVSEEVAVSMIAFFEENNVWHMWHPRVLLEQGVMNIDFIQPPPDEVESILIKMGAAFDLAHRRFLDLQKAETQAREAQIEAALERVRGKSMAMHHSDNLSEVIQVISDQLAQLDIRFDFTNFVVNPTSEGWDLWHAVPGQPGPIRFFVPWFDHKMFRLIDEAVNNGVEFYTYTLTQEEKNDLLRHIYQHIDPANADNTAPQKLLDAIGMATSVRLLNNNAIGLSVGNFQALPYTNKENTIFHRFGIAFEQTYTRFLDLQKAEAQAREAQIEVALERVRARALAMHSSEDLAATVGIFYSQLETFNLTPRRCGVGLLSENKNAELFTWNTTGAGQSLELIGNVTLDGHPVLENIYSNWLAQAEYHPVLRGNEIRDYYQIIRPQMTFPDYGQDAVHYGYFFYFQEGGVYAWTEKELAEDELQIYRRFTSVLSLTYKRYKDLKEAEARSKEAIKQAALDRVRAEIASMRTTADLERITPLIWRELTTLGIPFVRCGVFIMDEEKQTIRTFLSTPDGRAIAAFELPYNSTANLAEAINAWREHKTYVTHWVEKDFDVQAESLVAQSAIASREQYLKTIPKEGIHLHFAPFLQGMLYVGNTAQLSNDDLQLVQSVAEAFSTAYARYEDFNKLEAAKQQVDKALVDLKQTQQQLVQSEKMASLGELTAGIAHEIQNPLNFVNNFSEVNKELLTELKEEIEKGNYEEAKSLAKDVIDNEEKINHHGKRADGIVKGMLQHSRSSSGTKELTDINALCDEYLRLAYHGLRAKDKSFNAKFETEFDASLPKINVVPQDIGRVILNLITNAFYAVNDKAKRETGDVKGDSSHVSPFTSHYEPTVIVSTKSLGSTIQISVKDNGHGIPEAIKEKIFQPFFTTKPTGQGTGLGLSLSYDIVKVHGGELSVGPLSGKVETTDGNGGLFVVQLPMG